MYVAAQTMRVGQINSVSMCMLSSINTIAYSMPCKPSNVKIFTHLFEPRQTENVNNNILLHSVWQRYILLYYTCMPKLASWGVIQVQWSHIYTHLQAYTAMYTVHRDDYYWYDYSYYIVWLISVYITMSHMHLLWLTRFRSDQTAHVSLILDGTWWLCRMDKP